MSYRDLYVQVFEKELTPHMKKLEELSEKVNIKAWRIVDNPAKESNFISNREISILEHINDQDYFDIPSTPKDTKKRSYLKFFGEYGLSSFESMEECEKYMNDVYNRIQKNHGEEVAQNFFDKRGWFLAEVDYHVEDGWKLPTNQYGHFDFIRKPEWNYLTSLTGNYKDLNIKWHKIQ